MVDTLATGEERFFYIFWEHGRSLLEISWALPASYLHYSRELEGGGPGD